MLLLRNSLLLLFALALCASQAPGQSAEQRPPTVQVEAWQLLQWANQARAAAGAAPLQWDPALAAAARLHCLRMVVAGAISHQFPGEADLLDRVVEAGAHFTLIEENVAMAPTPQVIHRAWMNSPGHRANLLNPSVHRVGIAVVAGRDGLYAVADYESEAPAAGMRAH